MKNILVFGMALALSLAICAPLLAQEEQPKPLEPSKQPAEGEKQEDPKEQPDKPEKQEPEPTRLEKYISQLSSSSSQTREFALKELVKLGEEAVPEINKLLGLAPAKEPEKLPDELKNKIEKLIKELDADEWAVREAATKELEKIGESAESYLRRIAKFGTPESKTRAEKLIAKLEKKRRGGKSEQEVEQVKFHMKLCAVRALGQIAAKSCNKGLLATLADKESMLNTTALMYLRKNSDWSFGFGPKNLENERKTVVKKWTDFLDNPTKPQSNEAVELKAVLKKGDIARIFSSWRLESTSTRTTTSTVVTRAGQGQQPKREERKTVYTYVNELTQEQDFTDTIKEIKPGLLNFIRKYDKHMVGNSSFMRRPGAAAMPVNRGQTAPTMLSGAELEFVSRPGFCDVKALKGKLSLMERERLSRLIVGLDVLLPGKPVKPGDSWEVPELAAFKLLKSLGPNTANVLTISSLKFRCKLLEVLDKNGKKTARVSLVVKFGSKEEPGQALAGGNIVRISTSYGYGNMVTLDNATLIGDFSFDFDSGTVTSFKLFSPLFQSQPPDTRFGNRTVYNSAYGQFRLEVKGNREEADK
jgi:hypothetical protein